MFAKVSNQQKIDAYKSFPLIFGFSKTKEMMLHMVVDENTQNADQLIKMGERLIDFMSGMDVVRIQAHLLIKQNRQIEADKMHKILCVWEHQKLGNCNTLIADILGTDLNDSQGYVGRLNDWYTTWRQNKKIP